MLSNLISDHIIYAISQTVVHSLWQGLLVGVILWITLKFIPFDKAEKRYQISLVSLFILALSGLYTFIHFLNISGGETILVEGSWEEVSQMIHQENLTTKGVLNFIQYNYSYISNFWLLGVGLLLLRLCFNLFHLKRLTQPYSLQENNMLNDLLIKMKLKLKCSQTVHVFESPRTSVPISFGLLKSYILLPIGIINQLEPKEIEAILAHELAHILRNDFIINLFQSFVETLYYYHPVVWWISQTIKNEREYCCDQIALQHCEQMNYAKLLIKLQELRLDKVPALAMPLSVEPNQFSNRIKRILNMKQSNLNFRGKLLTTIMILSAFILLSFKSFDNKKMEKLNMLELIPSILQSDEFDNRVHPILKMKIDTTPVVKKNKSVEVQIKSDDQDVELKMDNDEITKLKIDGKEIDPEDYDEHLELIDDLTVLHSRADANGRNKTISRIISGNDNAHFHFDFNEDDLESSIAIALESLGEDMDGFEKHIEIITDADFDWDWEDGDGPEELKKNMKNLEKELYKLRVGPDGVTRWESFPEEFRKQTHKLKVGPDGVTRWESFPGGSKNQIHKLKVGPDGNTHWESIHENNFDHGVFDEWPSNENFASDFKPFAKLHRALDQDQLLEIGKINKIKLDRKNLRINGDKMPKNIHSKYLRLYEKLTGFPLNGKTKLEFELKGKERGFPRSM